jgi:murein DD-endopeptidase MepM/ murein hydrolase activator NlpD
VVRAHARKLKSRGRPVALGAAAVLACVLAASSAALGQSGGSGAYGGSRFYETPSIMSLQCRAACSASASATQSGTISRTGSVAVREKGTLRIRGRSLDDVNQVVFLGGAGRGDNMGAAPVAATPGYVDVKVPVGPSSGRIVLLNPDGHASRPSTAVVRVLRDPNALSVQGFVWPVRGPITGAFGEWRGDHRHSGIDIAVPTGTPIKAAAAGTVALQGWQGGYGNFMCLRHARHVTCYAHMSQYGTSFGQSVQQGQVVGRVGCTGNCSGPHLHFEVRRGPDIWTTAMDPLGFLPRR